MLAAILVRMQFLKMYLKNLNKTGKLGLQQLNVVRRYTDSSNIEIFMESHGISLLYQFNKYSRPNLVVYFFLFIFGL
jgi:hypothetical protein